MSPNHRTGLGAGVIRLLTAAVTLLALLTFSLPAMPAQAQAAYRDGDLVQAHGDDKIHLIA